MKGETSVVGDFAIWTTAVVFAVGLLALAVSLKGVQIDGVADYNTEKLEQSIRTIRRPGARGRILDRNGVVLAGNRTMVSLVCHAGRFNRGSWTKAAGEIAVAVSNLTAALSIPSSLTQNGILRHVRYDLWKPLFVCRDLSLEEIARISENEWDHPGFELVSEEVRVYPLGRLAAHAIGYVRRRDPSRDNSYGSGERFNHFEKEMCGAEGLEAYYDLFLRGVPGESKVQVDAMQFSTREWTVTEPQCGPDLRLTLDSRIQAVAEQELEGRRGACVVLDPRDGAVLAIASAPAYDLSDFTPVLSAESWSNYLHDADKPLLNRAVQGRYAPGSTFKPITSLAGLAAGVSPDDVYDCSGVFSLGAMRLRCSRRWGHGPLDLRDALRDSCNCYFCNLSLLAGTNRLVRMARGFGLGERSGIDLGGEVAGVVPDAQWKLYAYRERWYPGDLPQMSIGQGMLVATPLQMALVAGALGTGWRVTPHLKEGLEPQRRPLDVSAADLAVVREGMWRVANDPLGTGRKGAENLRVRIGGKTGTAEIGNGPNRRKNTWFIAFAPYEAPTVALAMVVEDGESGGGTTAPRVRNVLAAIFGEEGTEVGE